MVDRRNGEVETKQEKQTEILVRASFHLFGQKELPKCRKVLRKLSRRNVDMWQIRRRDVTECVKVLCSSSFQEV